MWKSHTQLSFSKIPSFGQHGYSFIYRPKTVSSRNLFARSVYSIFIGMQSDERLCRVYVPSTNVVTILLLSDFRPCRREPLPNVQTLLYGLALQASQASTTKNPNSEETEGALHQAFMSDSISTAMLTATGKRFDPNLPRNFREALYDPHWREAVDREFKALKAINTWILIPRTSEMNFLPFTWTFHLKPTTNSENNMLHKARCVVRVDYQNASLDYDESVKYAPVACQECISIALAIAAAENLVVEGGYIANAYLYGYLDFNIYMEQRTDSSRLQEQPG